MGRGSHSHQLPGETTRRTATWTCIVLGLAALVALTGCTDLVFGDTVEFQAEPADVPDPALTEEGYHLEDTHRRWTNKSASNLGIERDVHVLSIAQEYRRPLATEGDEVAGFGVVATPKAEVAGQAFSPVEDWSDRDVIRQLQSSYGSVEDLERTGTEDVEFLGEPVSASLFEATGVTGEDTSTPVEILVHKAEHREDFVVALAVYPQTQAGEVQRAVALFEAVEHPLTADSTDEEDEPEIVDGEALVAPSLSLRVAGSAATDEASLRVESLELRQTGGDASSGEPAELWIPMLASSHTVGSGDDGEQATSPAGPPPSTAPAGAYDALRISFGTSSVLGSEDSARLEVANEQSTVTIPLESELTPGGHHRLGVQLSLSELSRTEGSWTGSVDGEASLERVPREDPMTKDQGKALLTLHETSQEPVSTRLDPAFRVPITLEGRWTLPSSNPAEGVLAFLEEHEQAFRLAEDTGFQVNRSERAPERTETVVYLDQGHGDRPVKGGQFLVHVDWACDACQEPGPRAAITYGHGLVVPDLADVPAQASVSPEEAGRSAEEAVREAADSDDVDVTSASPRLLVHDPRVVNPDRDAEAVLAWEVPATAHPGPGSYLVYVDASTRSVVSLEPQFTTAKSWETWDAKTRDGGTDNVKWFDDGTKARSGTPPSPVSRVEGNVDDFLDFLSNEYGMDSIDAQGKHIKATANWTKANARWSGTALFGTGYGGLDVVGHELGHGIVQHHGQGLVYSGQSGALNEHVADVFGEITDCWKDECNWKVGLDANGHSPGSPIRSMEDPRDHRDPRHWEQLETYESACQKPNDYCGVHTNSGVGNQMFYLLAEGGTHPDSGVTVQGIGWEDAGDLVLDSVPFVSSHARYWEYASVLRIVCGWHADYIPSSSITQSDCTQLAMARKAIGLGPPSAPGPETFLQSKATPFESNEDWDKFGTTLATGDFDDDGHDDLAIGTPSEDPLGLGASAGIVSVVPGGTDGLELAYAPEMFIQEWAGESSDVGDRFGAALAAGDLNDDGYDDLAVGAPGDGAGKVIVFYGSNDGLEQQFGSDSDVLDATDADPSLTSSRARFGDRLTIGHSSGSQGSFLAASAPGEGWVHVLMTDGSSGGVSSLSGTETIDGSLVASGLSGTSIDLGESLAAGDFNDDGRDDLAIGAPGGAAGADGGAVVILNRSGSRGFLSGGSPADGMDHVDQTDIGGMADEYGDRFGESLAAGNLDGGTIDDLAVGVPGETVTDGGSTRYNAGGVALLFTNGNGQGFLPGGNLARAGDQEFLDRRSFNQDPEPGDRFGKALAVGTVSQHGEGAVVVGVPWQDAQGKSLSGAVYAFNPDRSKPALDPLSQDPFPAAHEAYDMFGSSVAAGDFDHNGLADVAIGIPLEDYNGRNVGAVAARYTAH